MFLFDSGGVRFVVGAWWCYWWCYCQQLLVVLFSICDLDHQLSKTGPTTFAFTSNISAEITSCQQFPFVRDNIHANHT